MKELLKPTSEGNNPLLEVKNLFAHYGIVEALKEISLKVYQGEMVALIGPNGAGKSTTLKAICGLLKPTSGQILFQGEIINGLAPYELVERGLSLVPEGRRVFTTMTVRENLEMGAFIRNEKKEIEEKINQVFSLFPILKERQKQRAGTLSSGEQQMLALGRALMLKPKLLLLDEPSLGLSPNFVEMVFEKIKETNQEGVTILLVEQNVRKALEYCHRGYVFSIGQIFLEDKAENLLKNEKIRETFLEE
ncbi:ABC transporter ATP-binding protein [Candidatus Shapirobacteria bacterium CG_4_8_14_3_um_filter_39_11]|uniref:ABC transporter ATP-binding protein n=1 Tax=Candidatus Shapirobacteria bacterium CG_4_8_14_3_um_filter_39_11 TaxID=1974875 RepID=A0A2M8GGQ7_9BACT|nr:MAG: ABC transporter ATP-binding protein [Candidatus Shapirobacteria bacterium CG_4_8_14_3_um_filter_39_11]